jgi:NAD(P)-dependent dehydrogenase (short-subunit alcohol dehydrogenase family)
MSKLQGKIAVITGGSAGIGLAIAQRFVDEGAFVFVTGRKQADLDEATKQLGDRSRAIRGDAGDLADLDRLYAEVKAAKIGSGRLDIVVANAGMNGRPAPLADSTPEHYDAVFGLNARGVFFTVQKSLPLLADGGAVVLVSSVMQHKGIPGFSAYSASKAAVRSFARTFAAELKERGIRVNSLSPGAVDTPLLVGGDSVSKEEGDRLKAAYAGWIPMGRIGTPQEIAAAALFLASGESSFATGTDLSVDGGFTQL